MKKDTFEKLMAFLLMKGSEKYKYGTLIKGFLSQFYLGDNQFQNTIITATYVLPNHILDPKLYEDIR